jgi:hypothetical protein
VQRAFVRDCIWSNCLSWSSLLLCLVVVYALCVCVCVVCICVCMWTCNVFLAGNTRVVARGSTEVNCKTIPSHSLWARSGPTDTHRHAAPQTVLECAIWHHLFVSFCFVSLCVCVCVCVCVFCVCSYVCVFVYQAGGFSGAPDPPGTSSSRVWSRYRMCMCVCVCVCVCVFDLDMLLPGRHNKSEEKAHEGEF